MTTETELVLMSMTLEELDDAQRWLGWMAQQWKRVASETTDAERARAGFITDGPWHFHQAMAFALVREQIGRGGGAQWFAGDPIEGHPEQRALSFYQKRVALSPGVLDKPRLAETGVLTRQCVLCQRHLPLDDFWWKRETGTWSGQCRPCTDPAWSEAGPHEPEVAPW